jgi:RNase H-like domain found in reverse transcriptase
VEAAKAKFAPHWTDECQTAFDALKAALVSAPVLKLLHVGEPFELVCDACEFLPAVGSVLYMKYYMQQGRPVSFFSRKLRGPELGYAATDIEMLSVIDALKEWRCCLEGGPFTIVTDHEPNTYLDKATIRTL